MLWEKVLWRILSFSYFSVGRKEGTKKDTMNMTMRKDRRDGDGGMASASILVYEVIVDGLPMICHTVVSFIVVGFRRT